MDKKKNNFNTYISHDNVFDVDYLDQQNIVLGKTGTYAIDDYHDNVDNYSRKKSISYSETDNNACNDEYSTDLGDIIRKLSYLSIHHVHMSYYPFYSESSELKYKIDYLDPDNVDIKRCPICKHEYSKKVYVVANVALMCASCYNSERIIY